MEQHPSDGISRRAFRGGALATTLAAAALPRGYFGPVAATQSTTTYPFTLGVASGDPLSDGVIL